ncbi:MAG: hypothetical protein ACFCUV_18415, partial [Rivularia sp. (in: cyanobacteria)]
MYWIQLKFAIDTVNTSPFELAAFFKSMEENLKILIIDDDEVDRMAVNRALKTAGIKINLFEAS